jgi:hypothetical protein
MFDFYSLLLFLHLVFYLIFLLMNSYLIQFLFFSFLLFLHYSLVFVFLNQTKLIFQKQISDCVLSLFTLITVSRKTSSFVRLGRIWRGSSIFTLRWSSSSCCALTQEAHCLDLKKKRNFRFYIWKKIELPIVFFTSW